MSSPVVTQVRVQQGARHDEAVMGSDRYPEARRTSALGRRRLIGQAVEERLRAGFGAFGARPGVLMAAPGELGLARTLSAARAARPGRLVPRRAEDAVRIAARRPTTATAAVQRLPDTGAAGRP